MNDTEQRIAIAEACGWSEISSSGPYKTLVGLYPRSVDDYRWIPDYLNNRNVMIKAIVDHIVGDAEKEKRFIKELNDILDRKADDDTICIFEYEMAQITASTSELAEAFLRTFEKWKNCTGQALPKEET